MSARDRNGNFNIISRQELEDEIHYRDEIIIDKDRVIRDYQRRLKNYRLGLAVMIVVNIGMICFISLW